ncbi:MAG: MotA/TolQ/ExbB proton channel family protein [Abitibacteriaceae bacterium]|nr:MotA/TolQ/ExbB proton channel family protein [Abditibacteriaceae bacterium]MBV9867194.1 MotA/TolQ/ExbB proton channel family protein [Abditibacteriaceae bacterium]
MGFLAHMGGLPGIGILLAKAVLVVFSIASVGVMIERAFALRRARLVEQRDYNALKQALMMRQMDTVRACVAASPAPCAAALSAGLSHQGAPEEVVREAIAQEVDMQNAALHSYLPVLATIASTAPYVGLFGTVLGILSAFDKIARTGQTGASAVAQPISEALITTALGLGVAIPAVMAYNYFSGRVSDLGLRVETHALDLGARLPDLRTVGGGDGHEG